MNDNIYNWARRHNISPAVLIELLDIIDYTRVAPKPETRHQSEAAVQADLRVIASRHGCTLWRNNNGAAVDETGRHVRYGLGNDSKRLSEKITSSDLIGITPAVSTAAGQTFGVFTAVEVKAPGWKGPKSQREQAQGQFISVVRAMGGIGMFAQSTADYEGIFGRG